MGSDDLRDAMDCIHDICESYGPEAIEMARLVDARLRALEPVVMAAIRYVEEYGDDLYDELVLDVRAIPEEHRPQQKGTK